MDGCKNMACHTSCICTYYGQMHIYLVIYADATYDETTWRTNQPQFDLLINHHDGWFDMCLHQWMYMDPRAHAEPHLPSWRGQRPPFHFTDDKRWLQLFGLASPCNVVPVSNTTHHCPLLTGNLSYQPLLPYSSCND